MSEVATQILAAFETLPPAEQHIVVTALLRRGGELQSSVLADDGLLEVADSLFQELDAEEQQSGDSNSR